MVIRDKGGAITQATRNNLSHNLHDIRQFADRVYGVKFLRDYFVQAIVFMSLIVKSGLNLLNFLRRNSCFRNATYSVIFLRIKNLLYLTSQQLLKRRFFMVSLNSTVQLWSSSRTSNTIKYFIKHCRICANQL